MIRHHSWIGPFLYGFAWTIVAPAILLWWAVATSGVVTLPALHAPVPGWILVVAGLALMAVGMAALAIYGCGLPMNAYPPPRYVVQGIYGWISHSFYVGFILFAFGLSTAYGSASGLWLVTPSAALALAALVTGYEAHDLRRRFGGALRPPRLSLPSGGDGAPKVWERVSVYALVLLPWLLFWLALPLVGVSAGGSETASPVLWITGAFLCATPLLVRRRPVLRRFAVTGLIGLSAAAMVYLVAPTAPLVFPLFCVLLAADAWWSTGRLWGVAGAAWAAVVAGDVSLRQGISPAGVLLTAALFLVTMNYDALWHGIRRGAEWLANSWREWRIGPVRIINHGFYAGLGGAVGFWIAGRLAGPGYVWPLMLVGVTSLLGAMLWGQYVEGSPMLLRPLGWYGGMVGYLQRCRPVRGGILPRRAANPCCRRPPALPVAGADLLCRGHSLYNH